MICALECRVMQSRSDTFEEDEDHEEALQEQGTVDREEASPEEGKGEGEEQLRKEGEQTEALRDERKGEGSSTEAVQEGQENEWEMVVDSEVPKTCAGFARIAEGGVSSTAIMFSVRLVDNTVRPFFEKSFRRSCCLFKRFFPRLCKGSAYASTSSPILFISVSVVLFKYYYDTVACSVGSVAKVNI